MKKILAVLFAAVIITLFGVTVSADGAQFYAESAPGGSVSSAEELIAVFGINSYGEANAELLAGSTNEVRLKNSVILESPIVIKSGEYTIVGGGCTVYKSENCNNAVVIENGSLTVERTQSDASTFESENDANIVFDGREKSGGAFIVVLGDSELTLNPLVLVKNMNSSENGGFIYAESGNGNPEVKIYTARFKNCKALNGGAVCYSGSPEQDSKNLIIKNSYFISCTATGSGGAIYSDTNTYISDVMFEGNSAIKDGGAVCLNAVSELNSVSSTKNKAENGGVLYNGGNLVAIKLYANENTAVNGGAVYNKSYCLVTKAYFYENTVTGCGGGVYSEGAFYFNDGNIMTNVCANYGGAIYSSENSITKIEKGDMYANEAVYGGGIYCLGELQMTGGTVGSNGGNAPQIVVFGKLVLGGYSAFYSGDVIGLIIGDNGEAPFIKLTSALTNKDPQRVAFYKNSNEEFKLSNSSGRKVFEGNAELIQSALDVFTVEGNGLFPYKISEAGEMCRAFPTLFVIIVISVAVLAVGGVAIFKVIKKRKKISK